MLINHNLHYVVKCVMFSLAIIYVFYSLRKGIVMQESIEEFREQLFKFQNMRGLTSEKKGLKKIMELCS